MDEERLQAMGDALVRIYASVDELLRRVEGLSAAVTALGQEVQATKNAAADAALMTSGLVGDVEALTTEAAGVAARLDQVEHAVSNIKVYRAAGPPSV